MSTVAVDERALAWEQNGLRCPACGGRIRVVVTTMQTFSGRQSENQGECTTCDRRFPESVMIALRNLTV